MQKKKTKRAKRQIHKPRPVLPAKLMGNGKVHPLPHGLSPLQRALAAGLIAFFEELFFCNKAIAEFQEQDEVIKHETIG